MNRRAEMEGVGTPTVAGGRSFNGTVTRDLDEVKLA